MMKKTLKILFYIILSVIILTIIAGTTIYIKYRNIEKNNIQAQYIKTTVSPKHSSMLGEAVTVSYKLKIPWDKKPIKLLVSPGKGSQQTGSIDFIREKYQWGFTIWEIECKVQSFVNGKIPEGKVKLTISPDKDGNPSELSFDIPGFVSKVIPVSKNTLNVASGIKINEKAEKSYAKYYIIALIAVLLILIFAFILYVKKRKKKTVILPLWSVALLELKRLKGKLHEKVYNTEKSISMLTDIVRNYLEARFEINASKQTTEEFLKDMESWRSPLSNQDRNFLREFMISADMIKFAKFDAPEQQIMTTIDRAKELIRKTIPEDKKNKGQKRIN